MALFGQAIPNFWLGIVMVLLFSVWQEWLPSGLKGEAFDLRYFIMPAIVVGTSSMAGYLRITRSSMLEILDSEFIRLARGKGASPTAVIWKHALRNSLIQTDHAFDVVVGWFVERDVGCGGGVRLAGFGSDDA